MCAAIHCLGGGWPDRDGGCPLWRGHFSETILLSPCYPGTRGSSPPLPWGCPRRWNLPPGNCALNQDPPPRWRGGLPANPPAPGLPFCPVAACTCSWVWRAVPAGPSSPLFLVPSSGCPLTWGSGHSYLDVPLYSFTLNISILSISLILIISYFSHQFYYFTITY